MWNWLQNNIGTVAVLVALAVIFGLLIAHLIKNKKQGRSSCGCCSECAMHGQCHSHGGTQEKQ